MDNLIAIVLWIGGTIAVAAIIELFRTVANNERRIVELERKVNK